MAALLESDPIAALPRSDAMCPLDGVIGRRLVDS
jgi:hypothetical protein